MKQISTLVCAFFLSALAAFGAGNGDQVRATNVFEGKLLSSISMGMQKTTLIYNENNQLISASSQEDHATFDYSGGEIDGFHYDVSLIQKEEDETLELYIRLNDQLFASEVYEIEKEVGYPATYDKWAFEYNQQGQLLKVKRTEGRETFTLTYQEGNVTKVLKAEPDETDIFEISYTDQIPNTSSFMMFDALMGVDLDEMEMAYFAGLLGKPTRCLPQKLYDTADRDTEVFTWKIDTEGYPTRLSFDGETFNLGWTEAAGINGVEIDAANNTNVEYFNLKGIPLTEPQKGLIIVRNSEGRTSKVIVK